MSAASVKVNQARNWDGFFQSPEYVKFTDAMQGQMGDQDVYVSPYFGEVTGQVFRPASRTNRNPLTRLR